MTFALLAVAVFCSAAVLDFVWARYTYAMTNKQVVRSGVYAAAIMCLGALNVIGYTASHWLLIPTAAGAFIGTAGAVFLETERGKLLVAKTRRRMRKYDFSHGVEHDRASDQL